MEYYKELIERRKEIDREINNLRREVGSKRSPVFLITILILIVTLPLATYILMNEYMNPDINIYKNSYPKNYYKTEENIKQYIDIRNMTECISIQGKNRISYYCEED